MRNEINKLSEKIKNVTPLIKKVDTWKAKSVTGGFTTVVCVDIKLY